jgi:hypothetical protein|tara:strand:- start:181 stop:810 length:630 start_codon:yes stop_codon:yes gene_type:complete
LILRDILQLPKKLYSTTIGNNSFNPVLKDLQRNIEDIDVILIGDLHSKKEFDDLATAVLKAIKPSYFLNESGEHEGSYERQEESIKVANSLGIPVIECDLGENGLAPCVNLVNSLLSQQFDDYKLRAASDPRLLEDDVVESSYNRFLGNALVFTSPIRESKELNTILDYAGKSKRPILLNVGTYHMSTLEQVLPEYGLTIKRIYPGRPS